MTIEDGGELRLEFSTPEDLEAALAERGLVVVSRLEHLNQAHDEGLVALAAGSAYWVIQHEGVYLLIVERRYAELLQRQLPIYRQEQAMPRKRPPGIPRGKPIRTPILLQPIVVWVCMHLLQLRFPMVRESGLSGAQYVLHEGEWSRVVTALTLHGDVGHLVSNCVGWILLGGFLASHVGAGMAFLLATIAGALGNAINLVVMAGADHRSLGASTALFAALGAQAALAIFFTPGGPLRKILVPVLSAMSLLALMGAGQPGDNTDVGAHLWGFVAGFLLALPLGRKAHAIRLSGVQDYLYAFAALAMLALAWSFRI